MKINADNHTLPHVMPHTGGGLDHATSHAACIRFQNLNLDLGAGCAQDETTKTNKHLRSPVHVRMQKEHIKVYAR